MVSNINHGSLYVLLIKEAWQAHRWDPESADKECNQVTLNWNNVNESYRGKKMPPSLRLIHRKLKLLFVYNKYTICDMFEQCSFTSYFLLQCAKWTGFHLSSRVSAFFYYCRHLRPNLLLNANSEGMVLNKKNNPICVKLSLDLSLIRIILIEKSLCIDGFL